MGRFIIRRLLQAIPTLFGITVISYMLMLSAPGDPISMIGFSNPSEGSMEATERLRRQLGMDRPPLEQYIFWLIGNDWVTIDVDGDGEGDVQGSRQGILRGDFGTSLQGKGDVFRLIVQRIPKTLQLTLTAFIVGYLIGIPIGVYAATHPRGWFDQASRVLSVVGNAIPGFWLALILILIFSVHLGWLTTGGTVDFRNFGKTKNDLWYQIKSMIMPVTVLSLGIVANISRFMRTETLEALEQDYIRTARAKGLNNQQVWWGHAVRNALIPIATFIGPALGGLLGGAVITEQIFGWPGMGRLTIQAVFQRDFPLIMASLVISSVLYIVGLIVSDVLYAWVDPRIRY